MAVDPSRLASQPLFADASEEEIAEAAAHFSERHVAPGTHLSREGGAGYFFFVIESGTADVSHDDGGVVATLATGDFFGEAAVLATTRRTATVTATSDMTVLEMFGADFAVLEAHSPSVHATVRAALAQRLS